MTRNDSWQQRYLAVVPEKLSARDASVILDLIQEDTDRFVEALSAFALTYEDNVVYCECSPGINPGCPLGDHAQGHMVPADWRVSELGDYDEFRYLCTACKEALARRPAAQDEYRFEVLGDETQRPGDDQAT